MRSLTYGCPANRSASKGTALACSYEELWNVIEEKDISTCPFVFDEIDRLKDDEILYNFSQAGGDAKAAGKAFSVYTRYSQ